jgi:hypothetical protein
LKLITELSTTITSLATKLQVPDVCGWGGGCACVGGEEAVHVWVGRRLGQWVRVVIFTVANNATDDNKGALFDSLTGVRVCRFLTRSKRASCGARTASTRPSSIWCEFVAALEACSGLLDD